VDGHGREILLAGAREVALPPIPAAVPGARPVARLLAAPGWRPAPGGRVPDVDLVWSAGPAGPGAVELARVELNPDGTLARVAPPAGGMTVPQAVCGSTDMDPATPLVLVLPVLDAPPRSATLYLRAQVLPTYYRSETGRHDHPVLTVTTAPTSQNLGHGHQVPAGETGPADPPTHNHPLWAQKGRTQTAIDEWISGGWTGKHSLIGEAGAHVHRLTATDTGPALGGEHKHGHPELDVRTAPSGAPDGLASTGPRPGPLADLTVELDGRRIDASILAALRARDGDRAWARFGDGGSAHPLAGDGTGAIDLLAARAALTPTNPTGGPGRFGHTLLVRATAGTGRLAYQLYLE
jgi:hypothetical protein